VSGGGSKEDLIEFLILEEFIALGLVRISLKTADIFCQSLPTHIKPTKPTRHPSSAPLRVALSNLFQDIEAAVMKEKVENISRRSSAAQDKMDSVAAFFRCVCSHVVPAISSCPLLRLVTLRSLDAP
jgi:hypothetical protein